MKSKLPAFTILEVIIAMLITAVLVAITYTAYTIVSQSYSSFEKRQGGLSTVLQLDKLLKRDFTRAAVIVKTDAGIEMRNDSVVISYTLQPDQILRVEGITDTFKIKTSLYRTSFENKPVDTVDPDSSLHKLDDLELELLYEAEKVPFHYHKLYSSADLFQQ